MTLTTGQRIDIKKKIAETLEQQEWSDSDLTLDEFGFPTDDRWNGTKIEYVVAMLRGASNESLIQLDGYLHPKAGPTPTPQPEQFDDPANPWSGEGFRLFVSHVHAHAKQAGHLRKELAARSIDAFVAHDAIEPVEDWQNVILYALGSCDACLALLTPGFRESAWTDQEVGFCMARGLLVVPVEFGLTPYGFLGKYQALAIKKGQAYADIALAVFELLARKEQSSASMARALVARWAATSSWDGARENYGFLLKVPPGAWSQQLVNETWQARDRNYDLRTASINWKDSDKALDELFAGLPFSRPTTSANPV